MRTRKMQYSEGIYTTKHWVYSYAPSVAQRAFVGDVTTSDEVHSWPPRKGAIGDVGGNFQQSRYSVESGDLDKWEAHSNWDNPANSAYNFIGPQFAWKYEQPYSATHANWSKTPLLSSAELIAKGATAISRCAPTNPHASVSQLLGELRRDGIPAIPGLISFKNGKRPVREQSNFPVAGEYLNIEFGWKPLFNDIRKLATAQRNSEKILKQYVRDSGRLVHRRYEFPTTTSKVVNDLGLRAPVNAANAALYAVRLVPTTQTITTVRKIWFEGAFTYHVNGGDDILSRAHRFVQEANHLTGVGITPGVLWDLAPWSWAADWFANTGDVLNNISMIQSDGLVVVYGYLMAETVTKVEYTNIGARFKGPNGSIQAPMILRQSWTETTKQRMRATPFGFGANLAAFTPRQLAIVAALGLSRDGRSLAL